MRALFLQDDDPKGKGKYDEVKGKGKDEDFKGKGKDEDFKGKGKAWQGALLYSCEI